VALTVFDERLLDLIDPDYRVEKLCGGHEFTEGAVWHLIERHLTFSDVHRGVIYRWSKGVGVTVLRAPSNGANGNTYDREGRLVTCEGAARRVTRTTHDGGIEVVADHFGAARLNEPNDVICAPNGDNIFSHPTIGMRAASGVVQGQEYTFSGVFRVSAADGRLTPLIDSIAWPNGLALTDDGRTLYVDDSFERCVYAFDIAEDGSASNRRTFAVLDHGEGDIIPDGMKLDASGNLYVAPNNRHGVWVYAPDGTLLGMIGLPPEQSIHDTGLGGASNLAWGDDDRQTMFVTAVSSVYRLRMKVPGQRTG
jgi:gluconolactonase